MYGSLHHLHSRQRQVGGTWPHRDPRIRFLDGVIYAISIVGPVIAIPQVITIWVHHQAAGVSLFYWVMQALASALWLLYGFVHKQKPLIISNPLWLTMCTMVSIGVALYG